MTFPDDSVQGMIGPNSAWWEAQQSKEPERGSLVYCYIPHADQVPYWFEPIGRALPTEHDQAVVKVAPLRVGAPLKQLPLPVAAMPSHPNEVWAAYRAKRRPCVVLSMKHPPVDKSLTAGKAKAATAPMMLVAPYFGVKHSLHRSGFSEQFVQRVQHCWYPQFMVDWLPHPTGECSILRLDQMQPVGRHHDAYLLLGYRLSDTAMEVMDSWLEWLLKGSMSADCLLATVVELLQEASEMKGL